MTARPLRRDVLQGQSLAPDLGNVVIAMLTTTMGLLSDRLAEDGFCEAAELVAVLVDIGDSYLADRAPR